MPAVKDPDPNDRSREEYGPPSPQPPPSPEPPSITKTQANHGPLHVRGREDLKVGETYQLMDAQTSSMVRIINMPSRRMEKKDRYIDVSYAFKGTENKIFSISLADYGVIPYENGLWHQTNRIMRIDNPPKEEWR